MTLKFLFISEYFPSTSQLNIRGGIEARTFHLAKYLAQKYLVTVIASKEPDKPQIQKLEKINIRRVGITYGYNRTGIRSRIFFIIAVVWDGLKVDFDFVEGSSFFGWIPALLLSLLKNKRRVLLVADVIRNYTQEIPQPIRMFLISLERFIFWCSWDAIICISHTVKNSIQTQNKTLKVIYCGVDTNLTQKIRVKKFRFHISCVARLVPYKRINDLIDAIYLLKSEISGLHCTIIGSGEEYGNLSKQVSILDLKKQISLVGFMPSQADVYKVIKSSQVFCLPSIVEGFGIAAVEALTLGVPVVLADTTVNREITQGQGALLFKSKNSKDLANCLRQIFKNKELYKRLINQGLKLAKKYKLKQTNLATEKLYESLRAD